MANWVKKYYELCDVVGCEKIKVKHNLLAKRLLIEELKNIADKNKEDWLFSTDDDIYKLIKRRKINWKQHPK